MEPINPDSLYALGMLYGKGDIIFNANHTCNLRFGIKYRRPLVASLRNDNRRKNTSEERLSPSVASNVFNEFVGLRNKFMMSFGVPVELELIEQDLTSWNRKTIILQTNKINIDSNILKKSCCLCLTMNGLKIGLALQYHYLSKFLP